ncbi:MAG: hypothetical protein ACFFB3_14950 [Candidatus Hodarchaeota archaeon]
MIGVCFLVQGKLDEADDVFWDLLPILRKKGMIPRENLVLYLLATINSFRGAFAEAEELMLEVHARLDTSSSPILKSFYLAFLIEILLAQEKIAKSHEHLIQLEELAKKFPLPEVESSYLIARSQLNLKELQLNSALQDCERAKELAARMAHHGILPKAIKINIQILLEMYLLRRKPQLLTQIEVLLAELQDISQRNRQMEPYSQSILLQGMLACASFDLTQALEYFQRAKNFAEEHGLGRIQQSATHQLTLLNDQIQHLQHLHALSPKAYEQAQMQEMASYLNEIQRFLER